MAICKLCLTESKIQNGTLILPYFSKSELKKKKKKVNVSIYVSVCVYVDKCLYTCSGIIL